MTEVKTKYIVEGVTINDELKRLRSEYLVLRTNTPLAVGIRPELIEVINLNSRNSRKVIRLICSSDAYLRNLAKGGDRFNLDGTVSGKITPDEMEHAKEKLDAMESKEDGADIPPSTKDTTLTLKK